MPINPLMLARLAAIVAVFLAGWWVNGWRWEARVSDMQAAYATATTKASEEAREREQVLADAFAQIDAERTAERTKADDEINRLSGALAAGAVRLHVAGRCPASGLPDAPPAASMGAGASPELDAAARPAYLALRRGLADQRQQLLACQALLTGERR